VSCNCNQGKQKHAEGATFQVSHAEVSAAASVASLPGLKACLRHNRAAWQCLSSLAPHGCTEQKF